MTARSFFDGSDLRKRWTPDIDDPDWDEEIPYGGKVYLARKKKTDSVYIKIAEVFVLVSVAFLLYYSIYHFDNLHFHVTHGYAHLGYAEAQHQVGQRYLQGKGTEHHKEKAMEWFRKAADQGHPHAKYNLGVGHMKGYKSDVKRGEVHQLMHGAAQGGVKEAVHVLDNICSQGVCD